MSIKQNGGVFGRNPTFNDVTVEGDLTVDGAVVHTGDLTVDNINLSGNTISTTDTNGDLVLAPNGTGLVQVKNATAPTIELRNTKEWNSPETGTFASIKGYTTDSSGTGARVVAEIELNNNAASAVPGGDWVFKTSAGGATPTLYERVRIGGGGNLTLASGNNVVFASGNGIDFSATAGAGSTSELLDDYEEGTWTPSMSGMGSATFTTAGYYRKIGGLVFVTGAISFSGKDGTNDVTITGLPFPAVNSADNQSRPSAFPEGDLVSMTSLVDNYGHFRVATSILEGIVIDGSGNSIYMSSSNFSASGEFNFSVTYLA
jgi:hypothetical protein